MHCDAFAKLRVAFQPTYEAAPGPRRRGCGESIPSTGTSGASMHVTSAETKQAILRAMGVDAAERRGDRAGHRRARTRSERTRLVPPCLVISETERPRRCAAAACAPEPARRRRRTCEIRARGWRPTQSIRGIRRAIQLPLPVDLPLGYHDVDGGAGRRSGLRCG